jgi:cbb3-type cytochrome oxidase maturation protein
MDAFLLLTVAAIALGALGVVLFFWTLKSGQYDDLDGAAQRILLDDDDNAEHE